MSEEASRALRTHEERACGNPECRVITYLILWPERPECPGTGCWQLGMPIMVTLSDVTLSGDLGPTP